MIIELPGADIPTEQALRSMATFERLQPGIVEKDGGWVVLVSREHRNVSYSEQEARWHDMIAWGRENNLVFIPQMVVQVGESFWQASFATYGAASLFYLRWS